MMPETVPLPLGGGSNARLQKHLRGFAAELSHAKIPDAALALRQQHRVLGVLPQRTRLQPIGRGWLLGVLVLDADGVLYEAGATTRALPPLHANYQSVSGEQRRALRALAYNGPFEEGEVVNVDPRRLQLPEEGAEDGPLLRRDGLLRVRWAHDAAVESVELDAYLLERIRLLIGGAEE